LRGIRETMISFELISGSLNVERKIFAKNKKNAKKSQDHLTIFTGRAKVLV